MGRQDSFRMVAHPEVEILGSSALPQNPDLKNLWKDVPWSIPIPTQ